MSWFASIRLLLSGNSSKPKPSPTTEKETTLILEARYASNPFLNLSDTIISRIFTYHMYNSSILGQPAEQTLAGVCVHWRQLMLKCPEFWTNIPVSCLVSHPAERITTYLNRAQGLAVELHLDLTADDRRRVLLPLIQKNGHRWRSLHLQCSSSQAQNLLITSRDFYLADFPYLEHLSIICLETLDEESLEDIGDNRRPRTELLFDNGRRAPRLQSLRIQDLGLLQFRPPCHHITTLHLEQHISGDMKPLYLSTFPRLVHLSLYGDFLFKPAELDLPRLLSLRSSDNQRLGNLLDVLHAPCLESLVLKNVRETHIKGYGYGLSSDPEHCRFPALRHVILSNVGLWGSRLRALLVDILSATRLDFVNYPADELLRLLSGDDVGEGPVLLPFLETLTVHQFYRASNPSGLLSHLLETRRYYPLTHLRVHRGVPLLEQSWGTETTRWEHLPPWPPGQSYSDLHDPFMALSSRVMIDPPHIVHITILPAEKKSRWASLKQRFLLR
ncbi:hypothetical protein VNI00_011982 [Paramarasmius palmivorus]|uniref:F-box domain-containing protein n=1 Tax=Paramarasmius palmivorus TaxID=297713 RepID=A0AAW0CBS3_9AGAR